MAVDAVDPAWFANLETAIGGVVIGLGAILGFVWHILRRIDRLGSRVMALEQGLTEHKTNTEKVVQALSESQQAIAGRVATIQADIAGLPKRAEFEDKMERFATRVESFILRALPTQIGR